jgi:hypothetical protein
MALSPREQALHAALRIFAPQIPRFEGQDVIARAMRSPGLRKGSPQAAVWLALVAVIRHTHTDYDALLDQGYDQDSARYYVREQINAQLRQWGSRQSVKAEGDQG